MYKILKINRDNIFLVNHVQSIFTMSLHKHNFMEKRIFLTRKLILFTHSFISMEVIGKLTNTVVTITCCTQSRNAASELDHSQQNPQPFPHYQSLIQTVQTAFALIGDYSIFLQSAESNSLISTMQYGNAQCKIRLCQMHYFMQMYFMHLTKIYYRNKLIKRISGQWNWKC